MADAKLTALAATATLTRDDLLYAVNDPLGIPASHKVTAANAGDYFGSVRLAATAIATATSVSLDWAPAGIGDNLGWIVIDPYTAECEVRKVTGVVGATLTVAALTYTHNTADPAFWIPRKYAHPEWFGAVGDGVTDDYTALQRCLTAMDGGIVYLSPQTTYLTNTALSATASINIIGGPRAEIKAGGLMAQVLGTTASHGPWQQLNIRHVIFDADGLATYALYINQSVNGGSSSLEGVKVRNAVSHGLYLNACQGATFQSIEADSNGGHGVYAVACNAATFYGAKAMYSGGCGILVTSSGGGTGGCSLFGVATQDNGSYGVHVLSVNTACNINGGWLEGDVGGGARIENCVDNVINVQGLTVSHGGGIGIHVTGTTEHAIVKGNFVSAGSIVDDTGNVNVIGPNFATPASPIGITTRNQVLGLETITNPGFEAGTAPWAVTGGGAIAQDNTRVHGGAWAGKWTSTAAAESLRQTFTITEAAVYYISAWVYSPSVGGPPSYRLYFDTGGGAAATATVSTQDEWVNLTAYLVAHGPAAWPFTVQVLGGFGDLWVDDCSYKRVLIPRQQSLVSAIGGHDMLYNNLPDGLNY